MAWPLPAARQLRGWTTSKNPADRFVLTPCPTRAPQRHRALGQVVRVALSFWLLNIWILHRSVRSVRYTASGSTSSGTSTAGLLTRADTGVAFICAGSYGFSSAMDLADGSSPGVSQAS